MKQFYDGKISAGLLTLFISSSLYADNMGLHITKEQCIQGDEFHKAAAQNNSNYIRQCLTAEVVIDTQEGNGWTALHSAARQGHIDIINMLLEHGANPAIKDKNGRTPLDHAILAKQAKVIAILKKYTAPNTGHVSSISIKDPKVIEAAEYAALELARWRPDPMTSPYLHSVISAKEQVVAGTNYILRIKTNDMDVYTWDVTVYKGLGLYGYHKLTSSKQIK